MPATTHITLVFIVFLTIAAVPEAAAQQEGQRDRHVLGERASIDRGAEVARDRYSHGKTRKSHKVFWEKLRAMQEMQTKAAVGEGEKKKAVPASLVVAQEVVSSLDRNQQLALGKPTDIATDDRSAIANQEEKGWWDSWGQCAAGTTSGSVFFSAIGSNAGGIDQPWGSILGAVGGAMFFGAINC